MLLSLFYKTLPKTDHTFYTTQWIPDYDYKKMISDSIGNIVSNKILSILEGYQNIFAYFMVKQAYDKSFNHAHQDWSIVDESIHVSINCWLPLMSANKKNGGMKILPKSHLKYNYPRGTEIKNNLYDHNEILGKEKFIELNLSAGDLLLFDSRLIHATSDNITKKTRVAVGSILTPTNSNVVHYYEKDNKIIKVELDNDFLLRYSFGENFRDFLDLNYEKDVFK